MQSSNQVPSQEMNVCLNLSHTRDMRIRNNYKLWGLNITFYSERWPRDTVAESARARHLHAKKKLSFVLQEPQITKLSSQGNATLLEIALVFYSPEPKAIGWISLWIHPPTIHCSTEHLSSSGIFYIRSSTLPLEWSVLRGFRNYEGMPCTYADIIAVLASPTLRKTWRHSSMKWQQTTGCTNWRDWRR